MTALAAGGGELPRRTTSDEVSDALRAAIIGGEFEDGQELNQVELAKHFGVSRVPVREALRQLQAEGLVSSKAHMRTTVTALTPQRVAEVLDLRILVEAYLLKKAAPVLALEDLSDLDKLCTKMEKVHDHKEWLALNSRFHTRLYAAADADVALDIAQRLTGRIQRYLHAGRGYGVQRYAEANAEHRLILEAIRSGSATTAVSLLKKHIGSTRHHILELLAREPEVTA